MKNIVKNFKEYSNIILESAPRIPKSEEYWKKMGKYGKDVCLIFHDDLDGIVSAIIMKNYLLKQGFKIKQYGIINYQEGWLGFKIDSKLITIALDFAENIPGVDIYIDHHGVFTEDEHDRLEHSIKTETGSAAEGIAQQIGVPFSNDTKNWIDMIDSAKYSEYDIDVKGILDFDLKEITKSKNSKLKFAAAFNQLLKRSDHKTFIEVVNASTYPSIYNIYRLFKLYYPKNNPNFRSGDEPGFVQDARVRLSEMEMRTRGMVDDKKKRYITQKEFLDDFIVAVKDENSGEVKNQLKPGTYQIIGNLMYVPSGTWSNALRAKAIFTKDVESGMLPDDPKLNFVLLQYGNTLQIADLRTKIKNMNADDLPKTKKGEIINNLGKYCTNLVENFKKYLNYFDNRTVSGGHDGIGSISNIFGKCNVTPYEDSKFLDLFKNKIISDISGIDWNLKTPWNEVENEPIIKPDEVNKKLLDIEKLRSEEDAILEKDEREILNYIIDNNIGKHKEKMLFLSKFKTDSIKKIYEIWLETHFDEIVNDEIKSSDIDSLYFRHNKKIEDSELFNKIVNKFNLTDIYEKEPYISRGEQRKELKRIFKIMFNIVNKSYIKNDTIKKFNSWNK